MAFVQLSPVSVLAKFEVCNFSRSRDNSNWSFGVLGGEEEAVDSRVWYSLK